jgi:hypothetical protein
VVLVVVVIPVAVVGGPVLAKRMHAAREVAVTIEVTGSAPTAEVEVDRGADAEPETMEVGIPWRTEFSVAGADKFVGVIAKPYSEALHSLSCRIIADGKVIAEDRIEGPVAHCSGDANGTLEMPRPTSSPSAPPTGPPPQSDLVPGLTLPAGSAAQPNLDNPAWERWDVPTPYADTVRSLRGQLPVGSQFNGLPFCFEGVENDLTIWGWGTTTDAITVVVKPSGLTTGSEVSIDREPFSRGCGG